jgi:hypothetical protein
MTERPRQPVGRGYTQTFDLLDARASSDESMRLEALWSTDNRGPDLDETLSDLGDAHIVGGRVRWDPPAGLDPVFADYLARSVEELNRRLGAGTLVIDPHGNITPPV